MCFFLFIFFTYTPTTEIYTLSLHDALPISSCSPQMQAPPLSHPPRCRNTTCHPRRHVRRAPSPARPLRSEEHTSELQSHSDLVCRLLLEKKKTIYRTC